MPNNSSLIDNDALYVYVVFSNLNSHVSSLIFVLSTKNKDVAPYDIELNLLAISLKRAYSSTSFSLSLEHLILDKLSVEVLSFYKLKEENVANSLTSTLLFPNLNSLVGISI